MEAGSPAAPLACEALVVGAGHAGLAAAIGLADAGFATILCGVPEKSDNGRTVALLDASAQLFKALAVWPQIEALAAPLRGLRLIDDTGSIWSAAPVEFRAREIGLEAFGWNIENSLLVATLVDAAKSRANLRMLEVRIAECELSADGAAARTQGSATINARLVVAADGRASPLRKTAGIGVDTNPYPQTALTVIFSHSRPHRDFSTEFQSSEGPFTLVPLPATPRSVFRSSLVWVMADNNARLRAALDDRALGNEIESQCRSMLGEIVLEGKRGIFPISLQIARAMTAPRLALVGDSAHALPPIGAQGLNLGLRDGAYLREAAVAARAEGRDIGGGDALAQYSRSRRIDVGLRSAAVDGLNRSLLVASPPINFVRGAALTALSAVGPLRRLVMREGVAPHFSTPEIMRGSRRLSART
jgi:2-octaprenyl-6-methoxyphenol hydroxylase